MAVSRPLEAVRSGDGLERIGSSLHPRIGAGMRKIAKTNVSTLKSNLKSNA
jgi:hypothetical protein